MLLIKLFYLVKRQGYINENKQARHLTAEKELMSHDIVANVRNENETSCYIFADLMISHATFHAAQFTNGRVDVYQRRENEAESSN